MNRTEMLIEADELLTKVTDPNVRIFDATISFFRQEGDATAYDTYCEGHIPGAAFFDHDAFSDSDSDYMYMVLPEQKLQAQVGKVGISAETDVIVYTSDTIACATRAWWVLRYAGVDNVRVLNGGLAAWQAAGGAVEKGPRAYEPTAFEGQLRPEMFVGKEAVLAAIDDSAIGTINSLAPDYFKGNDIVGSTCTPCSVLLVEMARFVPDALLAERLQPELGYERVLTYCGGGIAATVNAMAHLMVGNPNVAVYDGSMNEWAAEGLPRVDSAKPINA